jgi:hypothetical protein
MPRDLEILLAVGRMAEATTDQLRRLFFGDSSTASRRLAKLVSLRVIDVRVGALEEPNRYTLGTRAVNALKHQGIDIGNLHHRRPSREPDRHLRALNDLRVEFVLGCRDRADVVLHAFHADLDLRRVAGANPAPYVPDAIVEIEVNATPLVLMAEIDLGTEGLSVFSTKVTMTAAMWREGARCWGAPAGTWRPAVFAPTSTRARALARAIVDAEGGALWLIAELSVLRERGALAPIFATAMEVAAALRSEPIRYQGALAPALSRAAREASP